MTAEAPKRVVGIRQNDEKVVITIDDIYMAEATYDAVGSEGMRNAIKITTRLCEQFGIELQRTDE
jgi:hypothetical protein